MDFHVISICAVAAAALVAVRSPAAADTPAKAEAPTLQPLLCGYNPDPSICRDGDDYYLVTSSFSLHPGLPIYHSRDLRNWETIGHAWRETWPCRTDDRGIFAATIRRHKGLFYISVTWVGGFAPQVSYILTAEDPRGPWSKPVEISAKKGIDASLFFDGDDVWYLENRGVEKPLWKGHAQIWMQRIDVSTGRLFGDVHVLSDGFGEAPPWAEGPHLYKIGGKYVLLFAQGGTHFGHEEIALVSDCVTGPYSARGRNPVVTAKDWGPKSPLQSFGHADIVDTPDGKWYGVFLGHRMLSAGDGVFCPLGRETFMCPVEWENGVSPMFRRDACIAGSWRDPSETWYSLLTHPEWNARLKKVKSHRESFSTELKPAEAIVIYRSDKGYYARTNKTDRVVSASVALDGLNVAFELDGIKEGPLPAAPLCDQPAHNRYNGLMVGTFGPTESK